MCTHMHTRTFIYIYIYIYTNAWYILINPLLVSFSFLCNFTFTTYFFDSMLHAKSLILLRHWATESLWKWLAEGLAQGVIQLVPVLVSRWPLVLTDVFKLF